MIQPDQDVTRWDGYVAQYERMFEPLTDTFNAAALDRLGSLAGKDLLDVGAGTGGAALAAAARGARVVAVDGSAAMVARIGVRGAGRVAAQVADAAALPFAAETFGAVLSSFGVVLASDPPHAMTELFRVLRPGGRAAIVTWTEPHRYELATRLRDAAIAVQGEVSMGALPAQLRYIDPVRLHALLADAGFDAIEITRVEATLHAASAQVLAGSLAFAPGMAAMLGGLGEHRAAVLDQFVTTLTADQGTGAVALGAVAHIAAGTRPWFEALGSGDRS